MALSHYFALFVAMLFAFTRTASGERFLAVARAIADEYNKQYIDDEDKEE